MLIQISKKIKRFREKKYQKVLFTKKDINLRNKAFYHILNIKENFLKKPHNCLSCRFFLKNLNEENFIVFFKKFNANIQLKTEYDLVFFKKINNKSACFKSYIIFTEFLMKNKKINSAQKLNTILKINDLLLTKFKKNLDGYLLTKFKKNIKYEKKLINLYL